MPQVVSVHMDIVPYTGSTVSNCSIFTIVGLSVHLWITIMCIFDYCSYFTTCLEFFLYFPAYLHLIQQYPVYNHMMDTHYEALVVESVIVGLLIFAPSHLSPLT